MNATIQTTAKLQSGILAVFLVASMAAGIMLMAGHAQSATLHDAAHDMRHATGFPCH